MRFTPVQPFDLMAHQQAGVDLAVDAFERGVVGVGEQLATGSGKTVLLAEVVKWHLEEDGRRALIVAPRREIVYQIAQTIERHVGCPVGIEMASRKARGAPPVVVGTNGTLGRSPGPEGRIGRLHPDEFGLIAYDEGHHAVEENSTYRNISNWFGLRRRGDGREGDCRLIILTATLARADGLGLHDWVDEVVYDYSLPEAIRDGVLVDFDSTIITTGIDATGMTVTAGDFDRRKMAKLLDVPERNALAIELYGDCFQKVPFLCFVPGVPHANHLAQAFRDAGFLVEAIDQRTTKRKRAGILEAYLRGRLHGLVNCNVLTEGVDLPNIGLMLMLRPTLSQTLHIQMMGRGLRTWSAESWNERYPDLAWEGGSLGLQDVKQVLHVRDFVDNCGVHGPVCAPSLRGNDGALGVAEPKPRKEPEPEVIETLPNATGYHEIGVDMLNLELGDVPLDPSLSGRWLPCRAGWQFYDFRSGEACQVQRRGERYAVVFRHAQYANRRMEGDRLSAFQYADAYLSLLVGKPWEPNESWAEKIDDTG